MGFSGNMDETFVRELLMDHYNNSKHRGVLEDPDLEAKATNPSCVGPTHLAGDHVTIQVKLDGMTLQSVRFGGSGCTMSQAAASITLDLAEGKSMEEVKALSALEIQELIGITLSPARLECAELALRALRAGIRQYEHPDEEQSSPEEVCKR